MHRTLLQRLTCAAAPPWSAAALASAGRCRPVPPPQQARRGEGQRPAACRWWWRRHAALGRRRCRRHCCRASLGWAVSEAWTATNAPGLAGRPRAAWPASCTGELSAQPTAGLPACRMFRLRCRAQGGRVEMRSGEPPSRLHFGMLGAGAYPASPLPIDNVHTSPILIRYAGSWVAPASRAALKHWATPALLG